MTEHVLFITLLTDSPLSVTMGVGVQNTHLPETNET